MTIHSFFFGDPNSPPYLTDFVPYDGQPDAAKDNTFSFAIGDLQDNVDTSTLEVTLTQDPLGTPVTVPVISGGVFQAGFSGTITPNLIGGYDVVIVHPDWSAGLYRVWVYVADLPYDFVEDTWDFTVLSFRVESVTPGYLSLRVTFTDGCLIDSELTNTANYRILVTDPTTTFDMEAVSVTPEPGVANPTYVDLEMTDCTHGKEYTLSIIPDRIQSGTGDFITGAGGIVVFDGVSELPEIIFVEALSSTTVRVTFSKIMGETADILDLSHYSFAGGLSVFKVERETPNSVILTTSEQTSAGLYDLTVS